MRHLLTLGLAIAIGANAAPAQNVTLRLDFATGEANAGADMLSRLPINRAWSDSVSVYFNDELRQRGPSNLVRTQATGLTPNYRLMVQPLPMMAGIQPTGIVVYSVVLFRPPAIGTSWVYIDSTVGYTRSAAEAAASILTFLNGELRPH